MRKALLPLVASLALCGAATAALIATNARAAQTATQAGDGRHAAPSRCTPRPRRRRRPPPARHATA